MSSKGKKRRRNSERSLLEASAGTDDEEGVDMEDAVTRDNSKGKAVTTNGKAPLSLVNSLSIASFPSIICWM